jgi:rod shape determining protein RodA
MFVFSKIDYHKLIDFVPWAYGVCLVALVAVLVGGQKVLGARRWIKLGPMHFQPSEWVKLVLIIAVARYFANLGGRSLTWKDIFKAFALVGVPHAAGAQAARPGNHPHLHADPDRGLLSGRHQPEAGADS